jgi:hypothetical protein
MIMARNGRYSANAGRDHVTARRDGAFLYVRARRVGLVGLEGQFGWVVEGSRNSLGVSQAGPLRRSLITLNNFRLA